MELSSFKKGGHLQNVEEQQPDEAKDCSDILVLLRNFQFSPNYIEARVGSRVIIKVQQNKRDFSDLYQARAFILAVQELEVQSPPLSSKDSWSFHLEKQGRFEVVCINYCKLSFNISVTPNCQVKTVATAGQETPQESNEIQIKQDAKDRFEAFTYQEFESLICSQEVTKFEQIPQYLLRCFKTELNILEKMKPQQSLDQVSRPKLSSTVCREHSTNTQQCSIYEQFDQSRRASPGKSKALTIFCQECEEGERVDVQSRSLKKTSSQVINMQWKQQSARKQSREPSQTFEQQVQSFVMGKEAKSLIPSNSQTIKSILALLKNRVKIIEYIV